MVARTTTITKLIRAQLTVGYIDSSGNTVARKCENIQ